jgi:two-component system response regulator NreC
MPDDNPIKIILADDHTLVKEGFSLLLQSIPGIRLIGVASNGQELVQNTKRLKPNIVITDLRMPVKNGVEAIREICSWEKGYKCLAISMFENIYTIVEALEAGAIGYINKNAEKRELLEAIKSIFNDIPYYCRSTSTKMVQLLAKSSFNPYAKKMDEGFSPLEEKIIVLICKELTSKEISERLIMGKRNVDLYRTKILEKMKVKTTAGVAIYALKHNIISLDDLEFEI